MKKKLLTALQVVVTLGIFVWIFHDPKKRADMWNALRQANMFWVFMGVLSYGVVEILAGIRWHLLLRVQGIRLRGWRIGALLMIGIFFNMFMPGGTGGDVVKTFFLLKEVPGKNMGGLLAVLMDRVIGLIALIFLAGTIIIARYGWLQQTAITRNLTWTLLTILAVSFFGVLFSFVISGFGLAHKLPEHLPMRDKLIELSKAYNAYAQAWPASLASFFASFGVHLASFYVFICAARALNVMTPLTDLFTVLPIIVTISAMPISVGGNGVREGLFATLLGSLCHMGPDAASPFVPAPTAVVISLTGAVIVAFWGLCGGLIYLFYRPSEHARLREIEHQVHELEHEVAEAD